jgi:hypothetical protein
MPETLMDFETSVAARYALVPVDEFPGTVEAAEGVDLSNLRFIMPVGEVRLIRPTRKAMDFAVRLLLQTPTTDDVHQLKDQQGLAVLTHNVHSIARRVGLLRGAINPKAPEVYERELVTEWIPIAQKIQLMFNVPHDYSIEFPIGKLDVYIRFKSGERTTVIRPSSVGAALVLHAGQMITHGERHQSCTQCSKPFIVGGSRDRGKKKAGARFCSDECRWDYNNARRRKG